MVHFRAATLARAVPALVTALVTASSPASAAEPVMVQCGREYQAAKSAGTLGGADWTSYRTACADRLKAGPAAASTPASPAPAVATAPQATTPPAPSPAMPASAAAPSAGAAAMHARQKQCGAEWTAGKAALVAATPGLTWPRYWSQCNARLKAAPGGAAGR